jgi:cellulose biosynthesis protein BcsQ
MNLINSLKEQFIPKQRKTHLALEDFAPSGETRINKYKQNTKLTIALFSYKGGSGKSFITEILGEAFLDAAILSFEEFDPKREALDDTKHFVFHNYCTHTDTAYDEANKRNFILQAQENFDVTILDLSRADISLLSLADVVLIPTRDKYDYTYIAALLNDLNTFKYKGSIALVINNCRSDEAFNEANDLLKTHINNFDNLSTIRLNTIGHRVDTDLLTRRFDEMSKKQRLNQQQYVNRLKYSFFYNNQNLISVDNCTLDAVELHLNNFTDAVNSLVNDN